MNDKKYVGRGYTTKFPNLNNIEIDLYQLADSLGISKKDIANLFFKLYNKKKESFSTAALKNNKFTTRDGKEVKQLLLKISTSTTKSDANKLTVFLNEYQKTENTQQKVENKEDEGDDLPF